MKFVVKNMKFAIKNMKFSIQNMKFSIKTMKIFIKMMKLSIKNMKFSVYKVCQNSSFVLFITEFSYHMYRKNTVLNGKQKQMKPLLLLLGLFYTIQTNFMYFFAHDCSSVQLIWHGIIPMYSKLQSSNALPFNTILVHVKELYVTRYWYVNQAMVVIIITF